MVCDREVWIHLLRRVTEFSGERLEQLVEFGVYGRIRFGIDSSAEMMLEVAQEVASRCQKDLKYYLEEWEEEELKTGKRELVKKKPHYWRMLLADCVTVTISMEAPRGGPCTFQMAGESFNLELSKVAQAVGAKLTLKTVHVNKHETSWSDIEGLRMIAAKVEQQGEDLLSQLDFRIADLSQRCRSSVVSLIKASKAWTIQTLSIYLDDLRLTPEKWTGLMTSSAKGKVGTLVFCIHNRKDEAWMRGERP